MGKRVIVFLALIAIVSTPMAWAGGDVQILGSYVDPITGQATQFVNAKSNDAWRTNQTVIYAMTTDQELYDVPAPTKKEPNRTIKRYHAVTKMVAHDSASSPGAAGVAVAGFVTNLPNAGGLIGMGALLRPSNVSQNNGGGNANQTQGQGQSQAQNQAQAQNQSQNAFGGVGIGGAGGAGGSATINAAGGVGNTSIKASGNGKVNTGNASGIGVSITQ